MSRFAEFIAFTLAGRLVLFAMIVASLWTYKIFFA
jgi:hypothetical protein